MKQSNQDQVKAIISREDAKAQGQKKFYTGGLCRNHHQGERYVSTGQCVVCAKDRSLRSKQRSQGIKPDSQQASLKIISREDAKAQGAKRYYAGETCIHGHQAEHYTRNGECCECRSLANKKQHKRNPHHASTTFTAEAYPAAIIPLTQEEQEALANVYRRAQGLTQWSGIKHQVDHCYPLALGGVHHPLNLRVVPAAVNIAKFNKADPTIPSVFFGFLVSFPYIAAEGTEEAA